jgi:penicillin-binding protein 1A
MALPIWALYMQGVYEDPRIEISKGPFERPDSELKVELDCNKYDRMMGNKPGAYEEPEFE